MAKLVYKFEDGFGRGIKLSGGNAFKIHMTFDDLDYETAGTVTNKICFLQSDDPDYFNVQIADFGEQEIGDSQGRDMVAYGKYGFSIIDIDDEFFNLFFASEQIYDKESILIQLYKKLYGDEDYTIEFEGYLDASNMEEIYDPVTKIFTFDCYPKTDKLGVKSLHTDEGDERPNALGYTHTVYKDPSTQDKDMKVYDAVKLVDFIEDIFKMIEPDINITIKCNTLFRGYKDPSTYHDFTLDEVWLGIPKEYSALFLNPGLLMAENSLLSQIFGDQCTFYNINNYLDILNALAAAFMLDIGMTSAKEAFIREQYYYDESNIQSLGTIIDGPKQGFLPSYSSVRVKSRYFKKDPGTKSTFAEAPTSRKARIDGSSRGDDFNYQPATGDGRYSTPIEYHYPMGRDEEAGSNVYEKEVITWCAPYLQDDSESGWGTLFGVFDDGSHYPLWRIIEAKKGNDESFKMMNGYFQSNHYALKKVIQAGKNEKVKLDVKGLRYDFLKNIVIGVKQYQIISMVKNYQNEKTNIQAALIKVLPAEPLPEPLQPPRFRLATLASGWYPLYCYNVAVTKNEIKPGIKTIITVPKNSKLNFIITFVAEGFDKKFIIKEYEGDTIIGDDDRWTGGNETFLTFLGKEYLESDQDIVIEATEAAATGSCSIMFFINKKESAE